MSLTEFPSRWAPQYPDRLQLYSLATPNGKKIGIALEELELPYEAHRIDIGAGDQFDPEFVAMNPNSKIPVLLDPIAGPDGGPLAIMESGAILIHLAEKTGRLLPTSGPARSQVLQWLFFQVGGLGPMLGQFGHFHKFAREKTSDDYARNRYTTEAKRLLKILDTHLEGREYLAGDYSIADIANAPWVGSLDFYNATELLGMNDLPHVTAWVHRCLDRPAAQRGVEVCAI